MAANDKQVVSLEPVSYNDKNGLATLFFIFSLIVWTLGAVLTAFSALAYAGVGTFNEMFTMIGITFIEEFTIPLVIGIAFGVFFLGLFFFTISQFLKLLAKISTATYAIRGLEGVIPKQQVVTIAGKGSESGDGSSKKSSGHSQNPGEHSRIHTDEKLSDGSNIHITVNVNGTGSGANAASVQSSPAETVLPASDLYETPAISAASVSRETAFSGSAAPAKETVASPDFDAAAPDYPVSSAQGRKSDLDDIDFSPEAVSEAEKISRAAFYDE